MVLTFYHVNKTFCQNIKEFYSLSVVYWVVKVRIHRWIPFTYFYIQISSVYRDVLNIFVSFTSSYLFDTI